MEVVCTVVPPASTPVHREGGTPQSHSRDSVGTDTPATSDTSDSYAAGIHPSWSGNVFRVQPSPGPILTAPPRLLEWEARSTGNPSQNGRNPEKLLSQKKAGQRPLRGPVAEASLRR